MREHTLSTSTCPQLTSGLIHFPARGWSARSPLARDFRRLDVAAPLPVKRALPVSTRDDAGHKHHTAAAVLVVDEDHAARERIAGALGYLGVEVAMAGSGAEALAWAEDHHPVLVITEVYLPDMNGIDLVRTLNERGLHPALIFVSGSLTISRAVQAMQLGALSVLEKPLDVQALISTLESQPATLHAAGARAAVDPARFTRPRSIADRWATYVWKACSAPIGDPKTLSEWARCVGVSYSSLSETCRLLDIRPHDARDFMRVLRAIVAARREGCRADVFLDISDRRTLRRMLTRTGVDLTTVSPTAEEFIRRQLFIPATNQGLISLRSLISSLSPVPCGAGDCP